MDMIDRPNYRALLKRMTEEYCKLGYSIDEVLEHMKKRLFLSSEDECYCMGVYDERKK